MFKYVLQLIVGIFTLAVSTCIAWYEGSTITGVTWEWRYSTPFSNLFNIEISNGHDISQLDYFVFAAKYQPLFPAIMMFSIFYILSVVGYYLLKNKPKWSVGFWGIIGCMILLFTGFIFDSPTFGGKIFFSITLVSGLISVAIAVGACLRNLEHKAL